MKSITVYPSDIIPNAKYICDANGQCDLLGQILINGYGLRVPPRTRTPQCLQTAIRHFVVCYRQYVYSNTPLTQQLLNNTTLSSRKQIDAANVLLQPLDIVLVSEEQLEATRNNIQQPNVFKNTLLKDVGTPILALTNLERTSRYICLCGQSCTVSNLVKDYGNNNPDELMLFCPYCLEQLKPELTQQIQEKNYYL